ncbi:MAG: DUF1343 domain-containing protein [Gemmatimonadota bacterium]|jgi:uncharacterized protein YbbC (DUF1343 family)
MTVRTGAERLLDGEAAHLKGIRLGLVHHPASVTSALESTALELVASGFDLRTLFGPQHGAWGEKQDNMVESDHFVDAATGLTSYSLYGSVRKPTPEMLTGLDALLFDLQDVGVRVYTFVWTMALAMEACADAGVRFVVLDRPNPIGGVRREGPVLRSGYESFVGLHPIPLRHGLTCGELARWLVSERGIDCDLEVVPCEGWSRSMRWRDTGLPWVLPSPNLPTPDSCEVYPGMVLLEGTNLSEGRGTTRPFEIFGAPYLEPQAFAEALEPRLGPGVVLRPCHFEPTFQKHAGRTCGGGQLHVTDPEGFRPVHTAVAVLGAARAVAEEDFAWRNPPYEYETEKLPIDILWGDDGLRSALEAGAAADAILEETESEIEAFTTSVQADLLYD